MSLPNLLELIRSRSFGWREPDLTIIAGNINIGVHRIILEQRSSSIARGIAFGSNTIHDNNAPELIIAMLTFFYKNDYDEPHILLVQQRPVNFHVEMYRMGLLSGNQDLMYAARMKSMWTINSNRLTLDDLCAAANFVALQRPSDPWLAIEDHMIGAFHRGMANIFQNPSFLDFMRAHPHWHRKVAERDANNLREIHKEEWLKELRRRQEEAQRGIHFGLRSWQGQIRFS